MNTITKTMLLLLVIGSSYCVQAQVGINNATPDSSSVLDLKSDRRGLLIPRMNTQSRHDIDNPADGLLVYDTDEDILFYYYDNDDEVKTNVVTNWHAVTPFTLTDSEDSNFSFTSGSETFYYRSIATDERILYFNVFMNTPRENPSSQNTSTTNSHKAQMWVAGKVVIAYDVSKIPSDDYGLYVQQAIEAGTSIKAADSISAPKVTTTTVNATTVNATTVNGYGTIPIGGIIMWSGAIDDIPSGWALCNGVTSFTNTKGISQKAPDLRDRFVVGAGNSYAVDNTGGEKEVTLSVAQMPSHDHDYHDPGHSHGYKDKFQHDIHSDDANDRVVAHSAETEEDRTTNAAFTGITFNAEGGGQAHENRPPYYALAYIIRIQ